MFYLSGFVVERMLINWEKGVILLKYSQFKCRGCTDNERGHMYSEF
jgi:hypothetical protein